MQFILSDLAEKLGARLVLKQGKPETVISGLKTLLSAKTNDLSFLANPKYKADLLATTAGAVILSEENIEDCPTHALVMKNPYLGFAKIASILDRTPKGMPGLHPTAVIGEGCQIAPSASIGPYVVLGKGVKIGERVEIAAHCVLSDHVSVGEDSILKPNVSVYHEVMIGKRCIIHSGAVIGSDGFGMANEGGRWVKIPQLGSVVLLDDVEIGANTTIDRGALDNTVISTGVKIDNQVQIAHNVAVGDHTAIAAQVGIAGSTTVGKYCMIGGASGLSGHITVTDRVMFTAMTGVSHSIHEPGVYSSGIPCKPQLTWGKTIARMNRLDKMAAELKELKQQLKVLQQEK